MDISLKVILAPFVGAFVGWLASKGLTLTPEQQEAAIAIGAAALTSVAHIFHEWTQARAQATPLQNSNSRDQIQRILESAKLPPQANIPTVPAATDTAPRTPPVSTKPSAK